MLRAPSVVVDQLMDTTFEMSIWQEENVIIAALHILVPVVRSGSVKMATISSHVSSPLQNRERKADDVMFVLSPIQIDRYFPEINQTLCQLLSTITIQLKYYILNCFPTRRQIINTLNILLFF